jgi:NADPH2:quinone reductase
MRALRVMRLEGPDAVEPAEIPVPSRDGDVVIDVYAAGVSFADLLMTRGRYQIKPEPPFTPGADVAGIVRSAPAGSALKPGDRVAAATNSGGWAEVALASPLVTFPIPGTMSFEEATSLPLNYQTSYFGLMLRGQLRAGEIVLVHGAAGGVGSAAVQIARAAGATVIAVVHGAEKLAIARDLGAHHCIESEGDWLTEVRALTQARGVDVLYDPVGGERFLDSVRALAPGGRLLVVGFAGGSIPTVQVNRLLLRNTSVVGVAWPEYARVDPSMPQTCAAGLAKMWEEGYIKPLVNSVYPMERIGDALRELEQRRATGKIVLRIRP